MTRAGFTTKESEDFELMPLDTIFKDLYETRSSVVVIKEEVKEKMDEEIGRH